MKFRNILYIFLMVLFITLAYLFFDRGVNTKTKIYVNYKEESDAIYKVYLKENEIYQNEYLGMNDRYISNLVDYIDINFSYRSFYNKDINGYYKYKVIGILNAYTDDINDSIWTKEDILLDNKVMVIDSNKTNTINVLDKVIINYDEYKNQLDNFKKRYSVNALGYFEVIFKLEQDLTFKDINNEYNDSKEIKIIIPLSYNTFKIKVINDNNNINSYYDFSKKEKVNYFLLIVGAFSLSLGISFLALTVRNMVIDYRKQSRYVRELKKIINSYGDIIVEVKRFYNKKKYNLIYVNSFEELMDVYNKIGNPISYQEVKKGSKCIFLIVDDDNAWIYRMDSNI